MGTQWLWSNCSSKTSKASPSSWTRWLWWQPSSIAIWWTSKVVAFGKTRGFSYTNIWTTKIWHTTCFVRLCPVCLCECTLKILYILRLAYHVQFLLLHGRCALHEDFKLFNVLGNSLPFWGDKWIWGFVLVCCRSKGEPTFDLASTV